MMELINESIGLNNDKYGFTIIGWYKLGVVNNKSLVRGINYKDNNNSNYNNNSNDPEMQVDSSEILYYIFHFLPVSSFQS